MGDGREHYANLAVGKFSRHCKVHKDFKVVFLTISTISHIIALLNQIKVIVHIPMSQLPSTPLPLLNRFERYVLSSHLVLQELAQNWLSSFTILDPKTKQQRQVTAFEIAYEGCSDFVEKLHVQQQQNQLLYGIANKDTVCSLILSALELSFQSGASVPQLPPSFHVVSSQQNTTGDNEADEETDISANVSTLMFDIESDSSMIKEDEELENSPLNSLKVVNTI